MTATKKQNSKSYKLTSNDVIVEITDRKKEFKKGFYGANVTIRLKSELIKKFGLKLIKHDSWLSAKQKSLKSKLLSNHQHAINADISEFKKFAYKGNDKVIDSDAILRMGFSAIHFQTNKRENQEEVIKRAERWSKSYLKNNLMGVKVEYNERYNIYMLFDIVSGKR